ncbi:MAG: cobalt-precorrin-6A reductase [Rhizobiaceae bacterium]|nr:cobalt-precorrin-6A reductase [Rhizobiaceae bacterium]
MAEPTKILILGGTRNARDLAIMLAEHPHLDVLTSLAGRTEEPDRTFGKTRVGGFGGASGLAAYLRNEAINLLVDSTHPFATRISQNAVEAANAVGIKRLVLDRPRWVEQPGDNWIKCQSIEEAAQQLPLHATAFLALGHQYIDGFSHREDVHFIARMLDKPKTPLPLKNLVLIIAKPSHIAAEEADLFKRHGITHLVCRNSGGTLIYAKIKAARELGLPIYMLRRPPPPPGESFDNIEDLAAKIIRLYA